MAKRQKRRFMFHFILGLCTGGGWWICMGIWFFVKKI